MHCLQFCADLSKKSKSIKAIYIYASEKSSYALSEIDVVYYAITYCLIGMSVWGRRIFEEFLLSQHPFDILIASISWTVAQTPKNHNIFWKSVMRTLRCIYVNYFNRFLLRSAQNCKKCTFLDNLQTITQIGNMETRQMTPIFSSTFSAPTVFNIQFLFENSRNLFWRRPPLVHSGL